MIALVSIMPPQLVALSEGPNILLDKPIVLLGRHQECDIQLASRKISRRHCCIAQVNDYLVVRDLCSTNGVRINGTRVTEGSLRPGDELTIGNHRYQVDWGAQPAGPVPKRDLVKEAERPHRKIADDVLESCDEPIPLDEPSVVKEPVPTGAAPVKDGKPADPPSPLLPDELNLAPLSDQKNPPPVDHE